MRSEDGNIIHECLNGDSASFGLLVDKYKASIYALAYSRLRNFHDAEDVTQEVFIKAYKNLHTLRRWDSFLVWLRSMTVNLCRDKIKTFSRRPDKEYIEDHVVDDLEKSFLEAYQKDQWLVSHEEALNLLDKALESLPETYRQILTLHYLGGMNGEQISQFLSISHSNVRQRLSRAREQLREEMIAMMNQTFQQQKLSASFTFRIVELVKKIKINPISEAKGLPWGLSLGAGLILAVLMLGQHIPLNLPDIAMGLPMPSEMKVLKVGEIPVEAVKISTIAFIGSKEDGKGVAPDPKGQENAFFMAPQGEGKWGKSADMPTARSNLSVADVDGKIYAIGGMNKGPIILAVNEVYDPISDKWEKKADMPTPRASLTTTVVNGKIYAIGGSNNENVGILSAVEEYDPKTDKWVKRTDMPKALYFHSACSVNGKIYIFGGGSFNDSIEFSIFVYDPAIDVWEKLDDMPEKFQVDGTVAIPVDNTIYFFGGANDVAIALFTNVFTFNLETNQWKQKASYITPRYVAAAGRIDNKVYLIGGHWGGNGSNVEVYDIDKNEWTKIKNELPTPRGYFGTGQSCCVIDGKIYIIGGTSHWENNGPDGLSINEVYIPETIESKSVNPNGKLPKTWGTFKAK
jgi:RNA polymerase sigma factor (sigma-70 family)